MSKEKLIKKYKKINYITIPLFIIFSAICLISIPLNIIVCFSTLALSIATGIIFSIYHSKIEILKNSNEATIEKPKKENVKLKTTKTKKINNNKHIKIKELKTNNKVNIISSPKIKLTLNIIQRLNKELKNKKILFYVFLVISCVLLLVETLLLSTIILSIIAYSILTPTIICSIITIILHKDIRSIKFQLNLNEIINRDSN